MDIYVGNLSYDLTEEDLRREFKVFGRVASVTVITDKFTGRAKGFGAEAQSAITGLNGKELKGRMLVVNEARARTGDRGG